MPNRIFLIHGYVEDPTIFDKLVPLLPPANFVRLNLADEFDRWQPTGRLNVRQLAQYLTDQYTITAADMVIGHSMGGWAAINIKQLTGATTVQIASWTDQRKIAFPTHNLRIMKLMLDAGITQSRALINYFQRQYPFRESAELHAGLTQGTARMSRVYLYQQLQTLFAKVPPLTVAPDLRIHARPDNVIFPPDEPFVEVPGDHFCLVFQAEAVAAPIRTLLTNQPAPIAA